MSDQVLLENAAKAIGLDGDYSSRADAIVHPDGYWMPHNDDGDALRLAVHLGMFNGAKMFHFRSLERFGNPQATELECTRRAIVRTAAEIGESMP